MYTVMYTNKAVKDLQKMDKYIAAMLIGWIEKNLVGCDNPRLHGKPLGDNLKGYWRYRVGEYRLLASIQDELLVIEIIRAGHRRNVYDK